MNLSTAVPFEAAVERLDRRTPVGTNLRTRQWDAVPAAIKDRAFFSAAVEDARILEEMKGRISSDLRRDPDVRFNGKSGFVADMRRTLGAAPGDSGRLTDITSRRRLELIYQMNVSEAREYGRHKQAQSPALLEAFPARELIREASREAPREWESRWLEAGGQLYGPGRMIALVNDPIWTAISRFGRPYPPFDFGSGMGTRDVERDEAEALGVIAPGEMPPAEDPDYNASLEAGAKGYLASDPARAMLKQAFGDQIVFNQGRAIWSGDKIMELLDDALASGPTSGGAFRFGKVSGAALAKAGPDAEAMLSGRQLSLDKTHLWHAMDKHGPRNLTRQGSGETAASQIPLRREEFAHLNTLWSQPDSVDMTQLRGKAGVIFRRSVRGGILEMVLTAPDLNAKVLNPASIRKIKRNQEGGVRG